MKITLSLKWRKVIIKDPHKFKTIWISDLVAREMIANSDREGIGVEKGFDAKQIGTELVNPPITVKSREIRKYQHGRRGKTQRSSGRFSFVRKSK